MSRQAEVNRDTKETQITCKVNLDGVGDYKINTPVGFFTHMLETFSKHSLIDIELTVTGDTDVDQHHTIEDAGLALGEALQKSVGDAKGIFRNGFCLYPMDEVLVRCALDVSGRAGLIYKGKFEHRHIGEMESTMVKEFFHAIVSRLMITCHLEVVTDGNDHHMAEALFKAFAKSLRQALTVDERVKDRIPSTKGTLNS
jgi:imidazoleglycerol-phosphate dehydratase